MYKWWRPDYLKTTYQHFLCCKISSVENMSSSWCLISCRGLLNVFWHFRQFQTTTKQLWLTTECFPVKLLFLSSSKNNILNGVQIRLLKLPNSQVSSEHLNLLCNHDWNKSCHNFTGIFQPSVICASELICGVLTKQQTSLHGSESSWCLGTCSCRVCLKSVVFAQVWDGRLLFMAWGRFFEDPLALPCMTSGCVWE